MWLGASVNYGQTLHRSFSLSLAIWVLLNTSVPSPGEDAPGLPRALNYVKRQGSVCPLLWFAGTAQGSLGLLCLAFIQSLGF